MKPLAHLEFQDTNLRSGHRRRFPHVSVGNRPLEVGFVTLSTRKQEASAARQSHHILDSFWYQLYNKPDAV